MRICMVEEDQIVAKTLEEFISSIGHHVVVHNMVNGLLDWLEKDHLPPDIIIINIQPENTVRIRKIIEVHKRYFDAPIIAIINRGSVLSTETAISCGVYAFLRKPISFAELELILIRLSERKAPGDP